LDKLQGRGNLRIGSEQSGVRKCGLFPLSFYLWAS
jgi:hypothetical protein